MHLQRLEVRWCEVSRTRLGRGVSRASLCPRNQQQPTARQNPVAAVMQAYHQGYPAEPNNEGQGFGGAGRLRRSLTARRYCSSGVSRWRRRACHARAITVAVVRKIASATIHSTAVTIMCQMMARLRPSRNWSAHPSRVSLHESHIRSPVAVDANATRAARCPRVSGRWRATCPGGMSGRGMSLARHTLPHMDGGLSPMTRRDEYVAALTAGRTAEIGAANPFAGGDRPVLSRLWRRGYQRMLLDGSTRALRSSVTSPPPNRLAAQADRSWALCP